MNNEDIIKIEDIIVNAYLAQEIDEEFREIMFNTLNEFKKDTAQVEPVLEGILSEPDIIILENVLYNYTKVRISRATIDYLRKKGQQLSVVDYNMSVEDYNKMVDNYLNTDDYDEMVKKCMSETYTDENVRHSIAYEGSYLNDDQFEAMRRYYDTNGAIDRMTILKQIKKVKRDGVL